MHTLSTNCLYQRAYVVIGEMDRMLGGALDTRHAAMAARVKDGLRRHLWMPERGRFRYLVDPWGVDDAQEGLGHAFADLFAISPAATVSNLQRAPAGLPSLWPSYARYAGLGGERSSQGRHAGLIWPHVEGFAAEAACRAGQPHLAWETIDRFAVRALRDGHVTECYHPEDGLPDGGVQEIDPGQPADWHAWCLGPRVGTSEGQPIHAWLSQPRTTWGSTALWRLALRVLAGLDPRPDGLHITPCLPPGMAGLHLSGLRWRAASIDLRIEAGRPQRLTVDGRHVPHIPADASGHLSVVVHAA
jgi:glycogen debranching enzyme